MWNYKFINIKEEKMDINAIINHLLQAEKKQLLVYTCALQAFFAFPLTISCFAVAGVSDLLQTFPLGGWRMFGL